MYVCAVCATPEKNRDGSLVEIGLSVLAVGERPSAESARQNQADLFNEPNGTVWGRDL